MTYNTFQEKKIDVLKMTLRKNGLTWNQAREAKAYSPEILKTAGELLCNYPVTFDAVWILEALNKTTSRWSHFSADAKAHYRVNLKKI